MKVSRFGELLLVAVLLLVSAVPMPASAAAGVTEIHFLIPGGAGGGWDSTARGVGKALLDSGLLEKVSFENMSGGGGGKALNYLISNAQEQQGTLLVNSTPIIIRSLTGIFPQSFHDLTPIAAVIADYATLVVPNDSKYRTLDQLLVDFRKNPRSVKVGGGSVKGSMDHLVPAMIVKSAGGDPLKLVYVPHDAGGKAMAGLLAGDTQVLSTGFGEALGLEKQGKVRILAVASDERLVQAPEVPTVKESGIDVSFANWRGFFGAPGLPEAKAKAYRELLKRMYATQEWEAIRSERGWQNLYIPGAEFSLFLQNQEKVIGEMMHELGFIR